MRLCRLRLVGAGLLIVWLAVMPGIACAVETTGVGASLEETAPSEPDTPTPPPYRIQDDDTRLAFRGTWRYVWSTESSGYSRRSTRSTGSYVAARFSGTGITLVAPLRADGGIARVSVDGVVMATISLYSSTPATSAAVWSIAGLGDGSHVVRVTALGEREAASAGTVVSIDAFDIEGRPLRYATTSRPVVQQNDPLLYHTGTWRTRVSDSASKGSAMRTVRRGSAVKVYFKGTSLTWLGRKSIDHGRAEVVLDGKRVAIVGGRPEPDREKMVLWSISGLKYKTHTVVIRSLGEPSESTLSTATAVDVDAFIVGGTPLFAPRPTPFSYPWRTYIVVDKSRFKLYWVKDRTLRKVYPIAHGMVGWTTPNRIWRIDAKYHTSPSSVYGPRKMRMFKQSGSYYVFTNYAIHGTNQPWVIGTRASHGCIRMYNRDVLELFPQVPLGTMVITRD